MLKLGMKPVTGVSRVTIKRTKNVCFYLVALLYNQFPCDGSRLTKVFFFFRYCFSFQNLMSLKAHILRPMSYFGEVKIEDLSSQLQTQAAQQFMMPDVGSVMAKPDTSASTGVQADEEEEEEVDETVVEPRDIELVMTLANVSKSKAVKAVKAHEGDIVSAIMELTN
jgi:nascent polypeptide-associated complex subunit alpha